MKVVSNKKLFTTFLFLGTFLHESTYKYIRVRKSKGGYNRMTKLQCKLRAGKDDDLQKVIDLIPKEIDKADVIRWALREFFGLGNMFIPFDPKKLNT